MYRQVQGNREVFGEAESWLICGSVMKPPSALRALYGQAQCVYLDPPFMTGKTFARKRAYGARGWRKGTPTLTLPGFEDCFADEKEYLRLLKKLIVVSRDMLKDTGVFYLHLDWRMNARARMLCERIFGEDRFLNEIIWSYESGGRSLKHFPRKHDTILMYARSAKYRFDLKKLPLPREGNRKNHMARSIDENGRAYSSIRSNGKIYRYYDDEPVYPGDVWTDINILQQRDPERTGYTTQKPLRLLDRLLRPVVEPGELVADLCCGSGTTLAAAQALGCRFAGMDINPAAISVSLSRLKPENLAVLCPCSEERAELLTSWNEATGMWRLEGLQVSGGLLPRETPESNVESWDTGELRNGVFTASASYRRSFRYPELQDTLRLNGNRPPAALLVTDAAGNRRIFERVEEAQNNCIKA